MPKKLAVSFICMVFTLLFAPYTQAQGVTAFDSALEKAQAMPNDSARLMQLKKVDHDFASLSDRQVIRLANAMLDAATALHADTDAVAAHILLGRFLSRLSQYPDALNNYFKAIGIAERINDYRDQAIAYSGIAWIYKTTGEIYNSPADLAKATEYAEKGLVVCRQHNLPRQEANLLSALAIQYDLAKQHRKAIETFKLAGKIADSLHLQAQQAELFMNMGISYKKNHEFDSALASYTIASRIADSFSLKFEKAFLTDNIAYLYYEMGQLPLSEKFALEGEIRAVSLGENALTIDVYELLKKIYEKQGRYKEAFTYSTKLSALKDSVFNKDKSSQLKDMQEKYDTDIKDKQIVTQQVQIDYNKKLNVIFATGGIAVLIIAVIIYFNLRKTARLNKIVSLQRDELAKQSKSLSLMMKELHHRVKNNLQIVSSLLNLQSLRLTDDEAISAVTESKQRVQAMSLIHQRLYKTDDITRINMKEYINELAGFLAVSYGYGPDNFTLELAIEEEWTDIDKALPLGLILNELLTNAFKYAFNGIAHPTLSVSFKHGDGNIELIVKDNGTGMQPGQWDSGKNTSFGRQLIKALCGQLRAKEKLEVGNGTSFTYIIPAAA